MGESAWLSAGELVEATGGLVQPAAQVRFLRARGLNPIVGIDGRPRITLDAMTAYNLGQLPPRQHRNPGRKRDRSHQFIAYRRGDLLAKRRELMGDWAGYVVG